MITDDPMPVFVIKGKDALAVAAINAYQRLCERRELHWQADEVGKAAREIELWQERHPDLVKLPDHAHVPAADRG